MGIGGTGVVTVDSIVGTAALLEGSTSAVSTRPGSRRREGRVSHLRLFDAQPEVGSRIGAAQATSISGSIF